MGEDRAEVTDITPLPMICYQRISLDPVGVLPPTHTPPVVKEPSGPSALVKVITVERAGLSQPGGNYAAWESKRKEDIRKKHDPCC